MSIHISSDVFAHSVFTKETNGSILELTHARGADNTNVYPKRAAAAKNTASFGLFNAEWNIDGEIMDFAYDESVLKGYYIKGIVNNCIAIKESGTSNAEIRECFKNINY